MTRVFESKEFRGFIDADSGAIYSDIEFRKCRFIGSDLSVTSKPRKRSIVRDVRLFDCEEQGCALSSAIVEDVRVENVRTHDLFQTWGAVFRHVTLRGPVGRIMVSPLIHGGRTKATYQRAFDEANAKYYSSVDWALDIRHAEFEDVDLRGVPGHLVLRDPETQVLVTRTQAQEGVWRSLDLSKTYWPEVIESFLDDSRFSSIVLAAPRRIRRSELWTLESLIAGLRLLQHAGVAEPN